jgi:hypothetical protein
MTSVKDLTAAIQAELDDLDPRDETNPVRAVLERLLEQTK